MKLTQRKRTDGYVTSYFATIGCREAREAGFIREDGTSRILKKTVDKENGRIIFEIDTEQENKERTIE